jgi:hypothetical protein
MLCWRWLRQCFAALPFRFCLCDNALFGFSLLTFALGLFAAALFLFRARDSLLSFGFSFLTLALGLGAPQSFGFLLPLAVFR